MTRRIGRRNARAAVEESFRTLLNSEEADLLAENSQIVSREQQRLAELARSSGNDAGRWTQLGARIRVVLSETKSLEDIMTRLGDRASGAADRAKQLAKELKKQREAVDKAIAERGLNKDLLPLTLALGDGRRAHGERRARFPAGLRTQAAPGDSRHAAGSRVRIGPISKSSRLSWPRWIRTTICRTRRALR
jgi:hypothetical protein